MLFIVAIADTAKYGHVQVQKRCQDDIEDEIDRRFNDAWSAPIIPNKPNTEKTKMGNEFSQCTNPSFLDACMKVRSVKQKHVLEFGRPKLTVRSDIFA